MGGLPRGVHHENELCSHGDGVPVLRRRRRRDRSGRRRGGRRAGSLLSLVYKDTETLGGSAAHPGGYWSHTAAGPRVTDAVTIDPATNGGERAEVSVKGISGGGRMGSGPGGSVVADIEIRYA